MTEKKRFFSTHAKSSAMLISLAIHGALIAIAVVFVVASVMPKEDAIMVPKKVMRPKMPPKPVKVPVDTKKRKPKPRLRARILTERKTLVDIRMPETSGVTGGLGNMGGNGNWNLGFDIKMDLFGGDRGMGNELIGTFYDLKQTAAGKSTPLGDKYSVFMKNPNIESEDDMIAAFYTIMGSFARDWNPAKLKRFYAAPKQKFATFFMIPMVPSSQATRSFDAPSAGCWAIHYSGHIAAPENGEYRFWGYGDDVLLVRVGKKIVLDAGYETLDPNRQKRRPMLGTRWESKDPMNRKFTVNYKIGQPDRITEENRLHVGDWISLKQGEPVSMEVLFGDVGGASDTCTCGAFLLIEKKGEKYNMVDGGSRPVLPIFKTREIPNDLHGRMQINPKEATLTGPTFNAIPE